jgi:hypothetical protein
MRFLFPFLLLWMSCLAVANPRFSLQQDERGARLLRDGEPFLIKGVNWGSIPVGENYSYDLWSRSDEEIRAVLDTEMPLLKNMGVNAIRLFSFVPPHWITYIHETYGIHTVINHLMGRYGFMVDGVMQSPIDYSQPRTREAIKKDVLATVERYRNTPGVLLWMLGNENNYGLSWTSYEIENLPQGERDAARARHLYSLFGEIAAAIKAADDQHLVALCNGDLQYLDLVAREAPAIDLLAVNVYRGKTVRDLFSRVKAELGKPVFFSEFGSDAFNARMGREDGLAQAEMLKHQWLDIYQNSYGQGGPGNALGGFVFQWSDEWWKHKHTENLEIHDQAASWANAGYAFDYQEGSNNMNEEWFGIMAKSRNDTRGRYQLTPRPAYYLLKDIFALNPYEMRRENWEARITETQVQDYLPEAEAIRSAGRLMDVERFYLKSANIRLESIQSSGRNTSKETRDGWSSDDHMESVTLEWGWRPDSRLQASAAIHVLGHVAENKMDEIFYENRGIPIKVQGEDGKSVTLKDPERVKLHRAHFLWNEDAFELEGFYRTPHGHWADEGDFFGFFQETYDMAGVNRYNSDAPNGFIVTGKGLMQGWKLAFGPQIYWGAKPMAIVKYSGQFRDLNYTLMHEEAFAEQETATSSALSDPGGRAGRSSVSFKTGFFGLKSEWGLLQSGRERVGDRYVRTEKTEGAGYNGSPYKVTENAEVKDADTLAGKFRLIGRAGAVPWYIQGAYRGLVANGGPDASIVLTKWSLKPSERGNQYNLAAGFSMGSGAFSVAPQFVYQKPLVGPIPQDSQLNTDQFDSASGTYTPGLRSRNLLNDAFAVLDNREMLGAELLFVFDPTPDSWLFAWDNDDRESAPFAASFNLIYRRFPTSRDSSLGILGDGTLFAFPSAPPAADLWDGVLRTVQVVSPGLRMIHQLHGGTGQANGDSSRLVKRYGLGSTLRWQRFQTQLMAKWNDWGPYDYHRDFNLTFPFQGQIALAYGLEPFRLDRPISHFGVRYQLRTLDKYSPRYPYELDSGKRGDEQEWTSYVDINI